MLVKTETVSTGPALKRKFGTLAKPHVSELAVGHHFPIG